MPSRAKQYAAKPDSELAIRVRAALVRKRGITENRMFGGVCFYANGNMIGGVTGKEDLVVRVGPDKYEESLAEPHARPMDFTKRPMRGYVYVEFSGISTAEDLRWWLDKGVAHARSLPPKTVKSSTKRKA